MSRAWADVAESAEIRQGDVVRKFDSEADSSAQYGIVITADCDIAQRKTNDRMTVVRAVTVQEFIQKYWATWELEKLAEKQIRLIIPFLNAAITKVDNSVSTLTASRLEDWLATSTPERIFEGLNLQPARHGKEFGCLNALHFWIKFAHDPHDTDGFKALSNANSAIGRSHTDVQDRVREALITSGGFQDYLVIPNCPDDNRDGIVVLMREVLTIPAQEFLRSKYQARISDRKAGYMRIGRLTDRVRFAVAQRLAFVFSRIGMEESYEDNCRTLADLVSMEMTNERI